MVVDEATQEISLKLVYFGVALAGKSTNLQYVFARTDPARRSPMVSHANERERLLWFSLLPATLAPIGGKAIRISLHTVPGTVFYDDSRHTLLDGVDGVVFVCDSQKERIEANQESLAQLEEDLARRGLRLDAIPLVLQYNKRDLPTCMPLDALDAALASHGAPRFEAVAPTGEGVFATLKACAKLAYDRLAR